MLNLIFAIHGNLKESEILKKERTYPDHDCTTLTVTSTRSKARAIGAAMLFQRPLSDTFCSQISASGFE